ncbi:PREDICTED: cystatin-SA [Chinchilla lanigera]|uniref:cystatin-SA n=1 Tax=Chinchilla lanigera TaxID=34839 RepID=UPI00038EC510|nr:PREDICTED: cystatin-SA [Chinchilla lanigera]
MSTSNRCGPAGASLEEIVLMEMQPQAHPSDEGVQQAVDFALHEYNNDNNDLNLSRLVRAVRARQQVVGGMNYYLDLEIGRTTCAKEQSTQEECSLSEELTQLCSFVVHSRAWEDYMALISSRCHEA